MAARRTVLASILGSSIVIAAVASCVTGTDPGDGNTPAPPSATTSTVSLSASSVASGSSVTLTLRAKDSTGANVATGGAAVALALAGSGTSNGTIGAVTDNNDGTYTAAFTGTTAGSARQFSATLNGAAVTTTMPSITVTPGAASVSQSTVEVSAATVQSGTTATLTLRARDAASNLLTTGGLTVVFTKGAGTSDGTIGTVTDNANGTYTATFAATTAGSARSIGATIGGAAVTTAAPTITVTPVAVGPASPAMSVVTLSASTLASGSNVTITMQVKDASGANFTAGGEAVAFSLAGAGTSTGTIGAVTDNNNGTYSATLTGVVAGTARNVAATLNGAAVTTAQPSFSVTPGPAATTTSLVTVSSANVVTGNAVTLTLTAKDAAGNPVTTGGLTVVFTKGTGTSDGTIGVVTDNGNGTYTATFTATTAGTARSIGATIGGAAVTTIAPAITVTAPVVSAATSTVSVNNATIQSGTNATITLQAKDAAGANINVGGATVSFSLGAGTSTGTIGTVTDNNNGTYTATFTGVLVGTARSIAATVNSDPVTTAQPTITVTPGAVSAAQSVVDVSSGAIASGTTATLTLTAKDAAGNNLTTGGATVSFALGSGTSSGTIGGVTDNGNGTYSATFTGTTAGTARVITATINSAAVTTTAPTITVSPGAISLAQSLVSVSLANVEVAGTSTLTLTAKDAADNTLTTGGSTVAFTTTGGASPSTGTIGSVTDNNNGTYTATFTATGAGTPLSIGATIGGNAVTTAKPTLLVYVKGITLTSTGITANATAGQAGGAHLIGVFANGSQTAAGLQAAIAYTSPGVGVCQTANWLGTPTFDFTTANPFSILTINPTALNLGIYTCTATITISSTTPGVASQQFTVSLAVARTTVAQSAVNLVYMGSNNESQNLTQILTPDAKILITNGGRGIMTGLHATVDNQRSNSADTSWITGLDLSWENDVPPADSGNRTAPRTLVVHARVRPQSATAIVHVVAAGMPTIDIPLNVFFNISPELVTNPRGLVFNSFAGGSNVSAQVVAFNQNRRIVEDSLRSYSVVEASLPSWLTVASIIPYSHLGMDTSATITFTANPTGLLADSLYSATVTVRTGLCTDNGDGTCIVGGQVKDFSMPVLFVIERGLVVPVANATIFAAAGTATVERDIPITNGGSTPISGLSANVGVASWLSASFVGGTAAPTTLRLTANPTGFAPGTVLNTTVTVLASTPSGVPSRSFPVTFRVY